MLAKTALFILIIAAPALATPAPAPLPAPASEPQANTNVAQTTQVTPPKKSRWRKNKEAAAARKRAARKAGKLRLAGLTPTSAGFNPYPATPGYSPYSPSYSPSYVSAYSPRYAAPVLSPYVRRDIIPSPISPSGRLSPRQLSPPMTPLGDMSTVARAKLGTPGGPSVTPRYMRKGRMYKQRKAGAPLHKHSPAEMRNMEKVLEAAERVVNGVEERMNKPQTIFPELVAQKQRTRKLLGGRPPGLAAKGAKGATPPKST